MPSRSERLGAERARTRMPRSTPSSKPRRIIRIDAAWRRTVGLRTENGPFEKCFDIAELLSDHGAELALMRRDLKRGIDEGQSCSVSMIDLMFNQLHRAMHRFRRWQRDF